MTSQSPPPRPRRRIAGERKGRTPGPETGAEPGAETTTPAGTEQDDVLAPGDAGPPPGGTHTDAPDGEPRPAARAVPWPVMAALGLVAVVLLVLAVGPFVDGMGWQNYRTVQQQSEIDRARRTAPAAAERAAQAILAYDYKTLEADRDAAAAFMTPDYRKEYLDTFDSLVLESAKERKAHVEASVRASGVSQAGEDRVEVLLFVNQTTTSTANSGEEQTALNRVMFSMVRQDDAWRVDAITSF